MNKKEYIENIALTTVSNLDEEVTNDYIDEYIAELNKTTRVSGIPLIVSFKLFNTRFSYFVEKESLQVKLEDTVFEIVKGEDGISINEDINSITNGLSKEDAATKLIEYQKEKKVACKVYSKLKKKFLPKRKRKGLHRKKK
ncbi:MAG: hypothetical protein IJH20_02860 [Bacilli bacterium]|nr:hypothetical protein [Bacilli bacterium]